MQDHGHVGPYGTVPEQGAGYNAQQGVTINQPGPGVPPGPGQGKVILFL